MAQLDKIIKVMLDRSGADIVLATNAEPYLRVEGSPPHVLINRKLAAPHLRQLLGEIVGEGALAQLEASDGGEFTYSCGGQGVSVVVRSWSGNVEARLRTAGGGKRAPASQALGKIELTKAPAPDRRAVTGPAVEARAARAPEPMRGNDSLELDLGSAVINGGSIGSRDLPVGFAAAPSELEIDISSPPSSSANARAAPAMPIEPFAVAPSGGRLQAAAPQPSPPSPMGGASEPRVAAVAPAGDPPINQLFRAMIKQGCSDLHLSAGERPMIRRDGDMARLDDQAPRLKGDQILELLRPIMPPNNLAEFDHDHDTDFAYEIEGLSRFRGNVFLDRRGVGAVFRTIPTEIVTAEKLGLSASIQNLCYLSKGLVLVTGPTGSGKSTTLSALIDLINRSRHDHIITIEDPIEFVHQNKMCLINQRQVGPHTDSFKRALRAALREDPDVVMVGEMRDLETMAIAMETAETGHLVFGTLHTTTSYSTVDRLIDSFPTDRQAQIRVMLSESLKGVVSQTLCKKIGGGRTAAYEVLLVNSAVSNIIREGKTFQIPSVMQTARKQGMVLLNDALFELVASKKVDAREAYIRSADKANFVSQLRAAGHKLEFLGAG
ncbi:MAG: PilT/PilU family type 4a pilus ATPase [Polyangiaceae bacterium]